MLDFTTQQFSFALKAPAKINLHLEILGIRSDGFHELAMIMQSIDLADILFFEKVTDNRVSLICDNIELPIDSNNLIIRAANLLKKYSISSSLGAKIYLQKCIPIGAGLAGGSTNGAAALLGLNKLWNLNYSQNELMAFSAELGSDVPFTMEGGTQFCFGRGEILEPINSLNFNSSNTSILLIKNPQTSISTPWAFNSYKKAWQNHYLQGEMNFENRRKVLRNSTLVSAIRRNTPFPPIQNDLQKVIKETEETIQQGLNLLENTNQNLGVSMSGSGPSLFALFDTLELAQLAQSRLAEPLRKQGYESWCSSLLSCGVSLIGTT